MLSAPMGLIVRPVSPQKVEAHLQPRSEIAAQLTMLSGFLLQGPNTYLRIS